jgi:hypothetical protein
VANLKTLHDAHGVVNFREGEALIEPLRRGIDNCSASPPRNTVRDIALIVSPQCKSMVSAKCR